MQKSTQLLAALCIGLAPCLIAQAQIVPTASSGLATLNPVGDQVKGIWLGRGGGGFNSDTVEFQPWAGGLYRTRQEHDLEPHARCKASGGIRQFLTPYGVEIVQLDALERIYIFDIGGPHTYREIFMDGRGHPAEWRPTNYGHSIGWWDGDTLVVDTVGFNEDFWFERSGLPHTERAQVVETFRRTDPRTVAYTFTLTDPLTYVTPLMANMTLSWREGDELFEYICQQSNYAHDLMVVPEDLTAVGRTSDIVP
jgi:hypothetical protein